LGYGKNEIHYTVNGWDRRGWIYQQLLKLAADKLVGTKNYLVLDSDTVLVNKNSFIDRDKFVFQQSREWHEPYRATYRKLFKREPATNLSTVCHMMLFNVALLRELKQELEAVNGQPWDQAIVAALDQTEASSFSEYETYAAWVRDHYPTRVRPVPFYNQTVERKGRVTLAELETRYGRHLKSISFHNYANS
jgi:hypothetical protein